MRVAHIITRMIIGGAQENTLYNCMDLKRDFGDDVLLITGPSLGPEGGLLEQGRAIDFDVALVDSLRRAINPQRDWKAFHEIKKILQDFRPDVVHTHSAKGGILGREVAWRQNVPAILHTVHGAPFHPYQPFAVRQFYKLCEQRSAKRCHRLISVADAMTDLMVQGGVAEREKFVTIYSGMEVEPFLRAGANRKEMRSKLGFREDDVVVIKIARLFHLKGHADLIGAAANVVRQNRQLKFLLVGDGILRPELEAEIAKLGLTDHFIFTGLVPPSEIPNLLATADMLVHTSYREGLARALPQALISGVPAISYDVDGAREVVLDRVTGRLIPPGNIAALATAIADLAANRSLREEQGREGRKRFTDQFRHQTMTQLIRQQYEHLLTANSKAG